ncbi:MAG: hypothetical protein WBB29_19780 [Geitlerinemataceae cyanobacterium]
MPLSARLCQIHVDRVKKPNVEPPIEGRLSLHDRSAIQNKNLQFGQFRLPNADSIGNLLMIKRFGWLADF